MIYDNKKMTALFDNDIIQYLKNKNQGGRNNQKGSRYEDYFSIFRILEIGKIIIEQNILYEHMNFPVIYSQAENCFIDDLVIIYDNHRKEFFQIKNVKNIFWNKDKLLWCFEKQIEIERKYTFHSEYKLVLSEEILCSKMQKTSKNDSIMILHFPYFENCEQYLQEYIAFNNLIEFFCANHNDISSKLTVMKFFLAAWVDCGINGFRLGDVINKAKESFYLRPLKPDKILSEDISNILNKIPDFNWSLQKGHFHYNTTFGMYGTLPYDCHTERFSKFEQWLITQKPKTFEDIENTGWLV